MLEITVAANDLWDENREEYITVDECTLRLEHSLLSISKWESKWHKAFLGKQEKTYEESLDYVKCMCLNKSVDPNVFLALSADNMKAIDEYIKNPMSATNVPSNGNSGKGNGDTLTSEVIYYYMIASQIPFECEKWHLNRLIKLIEVCGFKNNPPKKMSRSALINRNRALNAERRSQMNSRG